jgi:hypothetical protein
MTKTEYKDTIFQRAAIGLKGATDIGQVTKFDDEGFSVLWQNETHSGNYMYQELKKDKDGALFVNEKRANKPKDD